MLVLDTASNPIDQNLVYEETFRLAQIRHRIFSESSDVQEAIRHDDEFMARISAVRKSFADMEAEAERLLEDAIKAPSAPAIAAAAIKRAGLGIAKHALQIAEDPINRERYLFLEKTAPHRKKAVAALWKKLIAEVKASPETEHAAIHSLRLREINQAQAHIEVLTVGYTLLQSINIDSSALQHLRGYCEAPVLRKDTPPPFKGKRFEYAEPAAAKAARENRDAARAQEESRKAGFVARYLLPQKF